MAARGKRAKHNAAAAEEIAPAPASDELDHATLRAEYGAIRDADGLADRLLMSRDGQVASGTFKRGMLGRVLHAWFVHPEKHVAGQVYLFTMPVRTGSSLTPPFRPFCPERRSA